MRKKQTQKTAGFGAIGVIVIVVAIALIGLVAWRFYDASKSKTTSSTTTSSTQANTKTPVKADPYAGWKTYCDTVEEACFKYPADWTIDPSNQNGIVSASILNPAHSIVGNYTNGDTRDGAPAPYYVAAVEDLSVPSSNFKVLGGFVATGASVSPEYKVVDTTFTAGAAAGQQATLENTARFTYKDGHLEGTFMLQPGAMTQDQAKTWFTTADAKTALLIARSFYLE